MMKEAESHADDDKKRRELVEAKNGGESLVHATEKSVKEYGDKVAAADKQAIDVALVGHRILPQASTFERRP